MDRFRLKLGLVFSDGQDKWTIASKNAFGGYRLEDPHNKHQTLTERQIWSQYSKGRLKVEPAYLSELSTDIFYSTCPRDLSTFSKDDQETARYRQSYIKEVKAICAEQGCRIPSTPSKLDPLIAEAQARLEYDTRPSPQTLHRWRKRSNNGKHVARLVNRPTQSSGTRDPVHVALFEDAVSTVFLSEQRRPGKAVTEAIDLAVIQQNKGKSAEEKIKGPSRATVYRWMDDLHYAIVTAARKGKKFTKKQLRAVLASHNIEHILSRLELDHTPLNVIVVCELTKLVLGRPWLTLALDRKSRMVAGFYIGFNHPSATSVLSCLRMAVLPKNEILAQYPVVKNEWPVQGLFDTVAMDNGMEEHDSDVADACLELGADVIFCGVGMPEMKGGIERQLGTLNRDLIHSFPGTTFSNPIERGDYPSEDFACLDIKVLTQTVVMWIVDVYHMTPHRGFKGRDAGKTPLQVWREGALVRPIEMPVNPKSLDILIGKGESRTVFHYGIQFDNLFYNSPLLQDLRARSGGTPIVRIKTFEHAVSQISVFHPELKEYFDVPATDINYARDLNRHVHRLICAEATRRYKANYNTEQLLAVKKEIQAKVEEALRAKKASDRKANAAGNLVNSHGIFAEGALDELAASSSKPEFSIQEQSPIIVSDDSNELPMFNENNVAASRANRRSPSSNRPSAH